MIILALDPGGTTGAVRLSFDGTLASRRLTFYDQVPYDDMPAWLEHQLDTDPPDLIVVERFFIGPKTVKVSRQPEALYIIGGVLFMAKLRDIPVRIQAASDAKTAYSNETLKDFPVGGKHAKDALRHAMLATHSPDVYRLCTDTDSEEKQ